MKSKLLPFLKRKNIKSLANKSLKKLKIYKRITYFVFLAVCIVATLNVAWLLIGRLVYEWSGPISVDTAAYWAMGRGILNGLTPYKELFDYKPPGIFLLSALSFLLTDSVRLTHVAQVIVLAAVPIMFVVTVWLVGKRNSISNYKMALVLLIALCMGSMLALYTGARAAWVQVESFGSAFIIGYGCLLFLQDKKSLGNRNVIIWLAVLLLCGIGFKEPFLLSALAVALVLCNDWFTFKRGFLVPLLVAGVVGIVLLWAAGWLGPYIRIYLYEVFNGRIDAGRIWDSGLNVFRIIGDIEAFSYWLALAFKLALLHVLIQAVFLHKNVWKIIISISKILIALLISVFAVDLTKNYINHHFVPFAPFFVALFILVLQTLLQKKKQPIILLVTAYACIATLLIGGFSVKIKNKFNSAVVLQAMANRAQEHAKVIDAILESCGEQRYLFLGEINIYPIAYTYHSPLSPSFFQLKIMMNSPIPFLRENLWASMQKTNLVAKKNLDVLANEREKYEKYLDEYFTNEPWDCAKSALSKTDTKMGDNKLLYRKGAYPTTEKVLQDNLNT